MQQNQVFKSKATALRPKIAIALITIYYEVNTNDDTSFSYKASSRSLNCSTCPHFNNFHEPNGRGWCELFEHQAREHHQQTNDCIISSEPVISHELEDNLDIFSNVELEAFPSEELEDEADNPHSEYQVGSIVKVIDKDENHSEWATFEVIDCMYNHGLHHNTESYLNQAEWYFRLASNHDSTTISKDLWVAENELCHFEQSHLISTHHIF